MGKIQVYTGNGKGKTTAALGLALRTLCMGGKVYMGQFIKGMQYQELKLPRYFPNMVIRQFGRGCFINRKPEAEDVARGEEGLREVKQVLEKGDYDVIILDELNVALAYDLIDLGEVLDMLKNRDPRPEVIITGRYAKEEILELADLVTEMKEVKHYYHEGLLAREGIEY